MLTIDAQRELGLTVTSDAAAADAYTHQRLSYRWPWEARPSREADMSSVPTQWPKQRAGVDVGKETVPLRPSNLLTGMLTLGSCCYPRQCGHAVPQPSITR